jgi:hypothetical protein
MIYRAKLNNLIIAGIVLIILFLINIPVSIVFSESNVILALDLLIGLPLSFVLLSKQIRILEFYYNELKIKFPFLRKELDIDLNTISKVSFSKGAYLNLPSITIWVHDKKYEVVVSFLMSELKDLKEHLESKDIEVEIKS